MNIRSKSTTQPRNRSIGTLFRASLTVGWEPDSADPGFDDFRHAMMTRSEKAEITICRIYCISKTELPHLKEHLARERKAGIKIRIYYGSERPRDMSLIYATREALDLGSKPPTRAAEEQRATALCALEFETRSRRSIDEMSLHTPGSNQFRSLAQEFDRAWSEAEDYVS